MKPISTAYVKIWDYVVGAVAWLPEKGYASFEYEPKFLRTGLDLSPIHMGISTVQKGQSFFFPKIDSLTFNGLPGLLASALPDVWGNQIINSWLSRNGRSPESFNPVERLCYIGSRGMGALEFSPQLGPSNLNKAVPVEIESLMDLAQNVLAVRSKIDVHINGPEKEKEEALLDILRVGSSPGGAVPKAIIAMNDKGHILSGQSNNTPTGYDHWILKFDGVSEEKPQVFGQPLGKGRIEYAYYLMAVNAGINMTECRLFEENGRAHFMTRRFDRVDGKKIHMLSLACLAHFGWNPAGAYGYEDAFQIMRQLKLEYPEQEQQYRRMVFNALSKNLDDHTKNISYTMDSSGQWKLSPAYDITFSYNSGDLLGDRHKMKINGKQQNFSLEDFITVAESMGINNPDEIIENIQDTIKQWPNFAQEAGIHKDVIDIIGEQHLNIEPPFSGPSIK